MSRAEWTIAGVQVVSWGNGLAYALTGPDGRSCYMQGDDAAAWREQYDSADETEAGAGPFVLETLDEQGTP